MKGPQLSPSPLSIPTAPRPARRSRLPAVLAALIAVTLALAAPSRPAVAASAGDDAMCAQVLALLNAEREAAGLPAIEEMPEIITVADERAREMAETGVFSHSSPSGADAYTLLLSRGVNFRRMGENIAQSNDTAPAVVSRVHAMLMASTAHRANMLDPSYGRVGIGIARAGGTYYFALVFAEVD